MALGLGFNKAKILQTAEKYVLQGKIPAAIEEYQKILRRDPKDLMTLNTVGDLYVRLGKMDEAVKCFYELAEKSIEAGFVPRAIAVYKRITKIDQEALPALTRLGELYSMQGLMRDARTHYLQTVDIHMRRREPGKAREIFEKVLMLDMENPRLQRRMAELYAETGKKPEAVATFLSAAERFIDTQETAEASTTLDALLKLDPENTEAKALRGRVLLAQGSASKAVEMLAPLVSRGAGKAASEALYQGYVAAGDPEHAAATAKLLFEQHGDFTPLAAVADGLSAKGKADDALAIYQGAAEKLQSEGAFPVLIEGLKKILKADPSNILALELLWGVYRRTGDVGEGRETAELLAHAYVAAEQLTQARDVYAELVALEPDVVEHQRLLKQVEARLGGDAPAVPVESGELTPMIAMDAAEAPEEATTRVGMLPPREQAFVKNCLTEAELYLTYHQLPRAIETLEQGLREVPGEPSLYEHLLPIYEQSQMYAKAAECAEALTEIYVKLGDGERATRYGELLIGYQQKAQESPVAVVEPDIGFESFQAPEPAPVETQQEPQVREIDLSMEWASLSESGSDAAAATVDSTAEEIEFYLQAGLVNEAAAAIGRLRETAPEHPALESFDQRLAALLPATTQFVEGEQGELVSETITAAAPVAKPEPTHEPAAAGQVAEQRAIPEPVIEAQATPEPAIPEPAIREAPAAAPGPEPQPPAEMALEDLLRPSRPAASAFELSLDEPVAPPTPQPAAPPPQQTAAPPPAAASRPQPAAAAPPASSRPAPGAGGGFLDDIFAEFKEDVGESASTGDADLETHYNMGVAFKEMALYDEAIGEFQKVHQLAQNAKDYSHVVQCCSLLATCFLEKGMPQLAAQWYQTAINSPGVDAESSLALLYELASAQETAGDRPAALKSFMEVYARNIDYRNVAERIRELKESS
jgi:tetratricopeptide (TPR) repeat protein